VIASHENIPGYAPIRLRHETVDIGVSMIVRPAAEAPRGVANLRGEHGSVFGFASFWQILL
jgi:hypothetical protein